MSDTRTNREKETVERYAFELSKRDLRITALEAELAEADRSGFRRGLSEANIIASSKTVAAESRIAALESELAEVRNFMPVDMRLVDNCRKAEKERDSAKQAGYELGFDDGAGKLAMVEADHAKAVQSLAQVMQERDEARAEVQRLKAGDHPDYPWKRALDMCEDTRISQVAALSAKVKEMEAIIVRGDADVARMVPENIALRAEVEKMRGALVGSSGCLKILGKAYQSYTGKWIDGLDEMLIQIREALLSAPADQKCEPGSMKLCGDSKCEAHYIIGPPAAQTSLCEHERPFCETPECSREHPAPDKGAKP